MPTHLRALVVILVFSLTVLFLAQRIACERAIDPDEYRRRASVWVVITLLAFLARNYWLYALLSVPLMMLAGAKDSNRLSFYFFLLFVVPPFPAQLPGLGLFGNLMQVDHIRWLALVVLLPAYISLRSQPGVPAFGRTTIDKFVLAYMLLWFILQFSATTFTNLLRLNFFMFIDTFLPYYVASRALRDLPAYRDALMSFVVAALIMSPLAMFEVVNSWLLYNAHGETLGLPYWGFGNYLERGGGILRAAVTSGHPIALGFTMAASMGLMVFLQPSISSGRWWLAGFLTLTAGLIAAMSRGPWVGAAAMLLMLVLTGPKVASKLMRVMLLTLLAGPLMLLTEKGQHILNYLPFVGTVEVQNVEFRERLFEVCIGVLANYPFFGALDFMEHPDMEQMRGGDGIIDMVNVYLTVAMMTGVVGLTLFVAPFVLVGVGILRTLSSLKDKESEYHLLGRCLLATLIGIMVSIATLASVLAIPAIYLSVIGMGAGYLRLVASHATETMTSAEAARTSWRPAVPGGS